MADDDKNTIENTVQAIEEMYLISAMPSIDRGDIYQKIINLQEAIAKHPNTQLDTGVSNFIEQASNNPTDGIAYRYALKHLNPFAVTGFDYENVKNDSLGSGSFNHNIDHSLDLFDPEDPETFNGMTGDYINDRGMFLNYYIQTEGRKHGTVDETNIRQLFLLIIWLVSNTILSAAIKRKSMANWTAAQNSIIFTAAVMIS